MKIKYSKPAISLSQQLDLLKSKNLILTNPDSSHDFLSRVSYHRFYQYFAPFLTDRGQESNFMTGASFENVVALYEFDKNLRALIDDALEVFEVAFRTSISNSMALFGFWIAPFSNIKLTIANFLYPSMSYAKEPMNMQSNIISKNTMSPTHPLGY